MHVCKAVARIPLMRPDSSGDSSGGPKLKMVIVTVGQRKDQTCDKQRLSIENDDMHTGQTSDNLRRPP